MAAGIASDVTTRRLPNALVLTTLVAGLAVRALAHGGASAGAGGLGALAVGALLWAPWTARLIGGGDLKFAAAAAAWIEPSDLALFVCATALSGGVLALAVHFAGTVEVRRRRWRRLVAMASGAALDEGRAKETTLPYGVAIAAGAFAARLMGAHA